MEALASVYGILRSLMTQFNGKPVDSRSKSDQQVDIRSVLGTPCRMILAQRLVRGSLASGARRASPEERRSADRIRAERLSDESRALIVWTC